MAKYPWTDLGYTLAPNGHGPDPDAASLGASVAADPWLSRSGSKNWTDDLFPALESFREFKHLKALDPLWPVKVEVADIGHPRAQNQPGTWHRINERAWGISQRPDRWQPSRPDRGHQPGDRL